MFIFTKFTYNKTLFIDLVRKKSNNNNNNIKIKMV